MRFILSFTSAHFISFRKQYASFIIMMALSATLIGLVVLLRSTTRAQLDSCEEVLSEDSDKVMIAFTDGRERKQVPIAAIEGVKVYGTYYEEEFLVQGEVYDVIRVSGELTDFIELSFSEGGFPATVENVERYFFVGAGVEGIHVGETITCRDALGDTITGTVCGRLAQGNRWLRGLEAFEGKIGRTSVSVDDKFLCFSALDEMPDKSYVFVMKENSMESKQKACDFLEERGGRVVSAAFLSDIFAASDMENRGVVRLLDEIVWLVIIATVVLMACMQTIIVLNFRRTLGIWYANGVSRLQAIGVFIATNVLSIMISLGLVFLTVLLFINFYVNDDRSMIWDIIHHYVLWKVFLSILAIEVIGFLLPLHTILSENLSELLRKFQQ